MALVERPTTNSSAKRLKKLGRTTIEARTSFSQDGKRYAVRRTFAVRPKR